MCLSDYDNLGIQSEEKNYAYHINVAQKMFWLPNFGHTIPCKVIFLISWQQ